MADNDSEILDEEPERLTFQDVKDAAIEAEFETGRREETREAAQSHVVIRVFRIFLGFTITIIGIIALPLPGPGWLIILAGLGVLAQDFAWAAKVIGFIRRRIPGIPEDGAIPRRTWIIMGVIMAAATSFSLWYYLADGKSTVGDWIDAIF